MSGSVSELESGSELGLELESESGSESEWGLELGLDLVGYWGGLSCHIRSGAESNLQLPALLEPLRRWHIVW